jgi:phosphatidylinositol 4-kinase
VLNFPQKVLDQPDALEILLGSQLPSDVSFQLKVCTLPGMKAKF